MTVDTIVVEGPSSVGVLQGVPLVATALDEAGREIEATPRWSTSDSLIASVDTTGLLVGQSPGSAVLTVTAGGDARTVLPVTVTPTDGFLLFHRAYDPLDPYEFPVMRYGFQIVHPLGGGARPIAEFGDMHNMRGAPAIAPQGSTLYFANYSDYSPGSVGIMALEVRLPPPYVESGRANPEYLREEPLLRHTTQPAVTRDGTRLAFVGALWPDSTEVLTWRVFIMNSETLEYRQLLPDSLDALRFEEPAWSPDGTRLALSGCVDAACATRALFTVRDDGSDLRPIPLPTDRSWSAPAWNGAGDRLVAVAGQGLYVVTLEGGMLELETPPPPDDSLFTFWIDPVWSGDDAAIFFSWSGDIMAVGADGTGLRAVTTGHHSDRGPLWWEPQP